MNVPDGLWWNVLLLLFLAVGSWEAILFIGLSTCAVIIPSV